jgi:hypothetical protein
MPACGIGTLPGPTPNRQGPWRDGRANWLAQNLMHQRRAVRHLFTYDANGFGLAGEGRLAGPGSGRVPAERPTALAWDSTKVKLNPGVKRSSASPMP